MEIRRCYPGGKLKALTLSYDDGVGQDIRLLEIMDRRGLQGTFNLNSGLTSANSWIYKDAEVYRLNPEVMPPLYRNQEVAVHSRTHPHLEDLPQKELYAQLYDDRKALEKRFGCRVTGMALAFWQLESGRLSGNSSVGVQL